MDKVKMLFLAADPTDAASRPLDDEVRRINDKLQAAGCGDSLELIPRRASRADDLLQALLEVRPQIVHFSGQGCPAGEILLKDEAGRSRRVGKEALFQLFSELKDDVRVVLLNACSTWDQAKAIARAIDFVADLDRAIGDEAAIIFAASFYRALGFGRSVQLAFDLGKVALLLEGIAENQTPQLFVHADVDAATAVLGPPRTPSGPGILTSQAAPGADPADTFQAMDRMTFVKMLGTLTGDTLELFAATLDDAAVHLSQHATVQENAAELVGWADSKPGPGLEALKRAFQEFRTSPPRPDTTSRDLANVLPGNYMIHRSLGVGVMSQVVLAHDKQLERRVAIKVLTDPKVAPLFADAARAAVKVTKHPNFPSIYWASLDKQPYYYVREYIDGISLRGMLNRNGEGPLAIAFIHQVLAAVGDAIGFAQEHMANDIDVKPEKILIQDLQRKTHLAGHDRHKILIYPDVASVEVLSRDVEPRAMASLIYQPPECLRGYNYYETRRDWSNQYRLGIIGYEMLVGSQRFGELALDRSKDLARMRQQDEPVELAELPPIEALTRRGCPRFLSLAIERMTDPRPERRFDTLGDAVNAIANRNLDVEVARDSYRRILDDPAQEVEFFQTFYDRFLHRCPDAAKVFAAKGFPGRSSRGKRGIRDSRGKWQRQYSLLKHAIVMLLAFNMLGETEEPTILKNIADSHKGFPRPFYKEFREALLDTVLEFDEASGTGLQRDELRYAWERAIEPGIAYMMDHS